VPIANNISYRDASNKNVYATEVQDRNTLVNHVPSAVTDSRDSLNVVVKHALELVEVTLSCSCEQI
jgi:hypothetical protein